jgi:outer membrane protein OmpA-like peptidoglycan-associated protein
MEGGTQPNADIYYSDNIDGGWQAIKKVPAINHPIYWDSQPSISADGNTLYFVSDRPGGVGKLDIWKSERNPITHQWQAPVNLGSKINTSGNEKCPFIHSDSETLYYSSDGLFGFGGLDIFFVHKDDKGNWKEPENIGTPINGEGDDAGFFVSTDGINGYFCSNDVGKVRGKGVGKYDVYYFELYKEARPEAVTFLRGEVKQESGAPVASAVVELKNTKTKEITKAVYDSTDGSYVAAINLKKNKDPMVVTVKAPDYSFASQTIELKEASFEKPPPPATLNVEIAEKGKSFVIDNIQYATGAADLYPQSFSTLDEFAAYLKLNPSMKIEIQGHTDNVGKDEDNRLLSEKRAENVKKYLEEKGIVANRITAKGYGASKPIADNGTVAGKAKNRRTAFLILDK